MQEEQFILLVKHFSGETTKEEENAISTFLKNDTSALKEYMALQKSWDNGIMLKKNYSTEKGLQNLKRKIKQKKLHVQRLYLLRVAAVFVGFILAGSFLWIDYTKQITIEATSAVEKVLLPDSSLVYLKNGTQISYNSSYLWKFNREVKLVGGAFFEIKKQNNNKFIVNTNGFNVQVLGTKFNIKSTDKKTEIILTEGNVRLFNFLNNGDDIYMAPNDQVSYNLITNTICKSTVKTDLSSIWKEGFISFKDFSLEEIAQIIEQIFGKEVVITNNNLLSKSLSGSAPIDDLNILLKALSEILGDDIKTQDNTIVIN